MTEEFWPGISIGNMNVSQIQEFRRASRTKDQA